MKPLPLTPDEADQQRREIVSRQADVSIGEYLVICEPNGSGNVYADEGHGDHVYHAETFKEAKSWVYEQIGEADPEADEPAPESPRREQQKRPCKQCPWRRKAMPGWLGASHPEGFVATALLDVEPLPCHSTIDYSRPDWLARWNAGTSKRAKLCAGALTAAANVGRLLRHGAPVERDHETVFSSFAEFIEHHRRSPIVSWVDPPVGSPERDGINQVRRRVGLPMLRAQTRKGNTDGQ